MENKVPVHSGIACLNPKALTVLGGVVQSLYEEWQMNQKYSGFSRSSLRKLEDGDTGGPPPFVKLQVGSSSGQKEKIFFCYCIVLLVRALLLYMDIVFLVLANVVKIKNAYYEYTKLEFIVKCWHIDKVSSLSTSYL